MGKRVALFLFVLSLSVEAANAQGCLPGEECGGGDPDTTPSSPIDGGVSLLLGAAALYGAKKLRDRKNDSPID